VATLLATSADCVAKPLSPFSAVNRNFVVLCVDLCNLEFINCAVICIRGNVCSSSSVVRALCVGKQSGGLSLHWYIAAST